VTRPVRDPRCGFTTHACSTDKRISLLGYGRVRHGRRNIFNRRASYGYMYSPKLLVEENSSAATRHGESRRTPLDRRTVPDRSWYKPSGTEYTWVRITVDLSDPYCSRDVQNAYRQYYSVIIRTDSVDSNHDGAGTNARHD